LNLGGWASNELPVFIVMLPTHSIFWLAFSCPVLSMLSAANGITMTHGVLFTSEQIED
jgi:hypothetical protein